MRSAVSVARFAEFLLAFLGIFIFALPSYAVNGRTTYSAKIYKPDGYPLESASVNFRFSVLDPTGSCVLYVEDYSSVNMIGGGGLISLTLGNGVRSYPSSGTLTFAQVFDNAIPMFNCQTPGAYNPISTDNRKIVMQFNDSNGWQTLPAMAINAVPYAMYATKSQDSLTLNGKADTAFVQKNSSDIPTCAAGQMLYFNGASFSCVAVTASGTVTSVAAAAPLSSSGGSTPTISITQATSSTNGYLSSTDWTMFNNKQSATSGAIIATLGYTPLDSVNQSGVVSGTQYTKVTVDGNGRVTSGAQLTNSDVTTALGYTPANSATTVSSQWVTTGSNIYYNTGNVGIGTTSPAYKFHVQDGPAVIKGTNGTLTVKKGFGSPNALSSESVASFDNESAGTGVALNMFVFPQTNASIYFGDTGSPQQGILRYHIDSTTTSNQYMSFTVSSTETMRIDAFGRVAIGTAAPTATLHLKAGAATANTAPLKFTSGTLLTSPESGTVEYDGTNLYFTDSTNTRRTITSTSGSGTYDNAATISNSSGNITMYPNGGAGSVVVSATTASTSSNTGALVVKGGLGVAGTANVAQNLNVSGSSVIDGSLKLSSMTSGSVLFAGAGGAITQDNSNFYWDGANKQLGIGTTTPVYMLDVSSTTRLSSSTSGGVRIGNGQIRVDSNADAGSALSIRATQLIAGATNAQSYSYSDGALLGSVGTGASTLLLDVGSYTASASALRVTLDGTGLRPIINLADKVTGSSTFYANSATGNVGIGTTSPVAALHVNSSSGAPSLYLQNTSTSLPYLQFQQGGFIQSMDADGSLRMRSPAGSGFLVFDTNGANERMRIDSTGNVGIGTTAPAKKLDVNGDINLGNTTGNSALTIISNATTGLSRLVMDPGTGNNRGFLDYDNSSRAMILRTNEVERMRIDTSGNVGIGTTAPSELLHVSGSAVIGDMKFWKNLTGGEFQAITGNGDLRPHMGTSGSFRLYSGNVGGGSEKFTVLNSGNVGIGTTTPTATLHLKAGTAAANTAPLKFTSGTLLTSPESGTIEYDGTNLYFTDGTNARRTLAATAGSGTYDSASLISNASGNITMYPNGGAGSVIVSATTASTSSNTGALVVKGGLGVAGSTNIAQNLNVSGSSVIDGSLKLSSMTSGSVLFAGGGGALTQDNSNFYWDGANKRLGIGTASPLAALNIEKLADATSAGVGNLALLINQRNAGNSEVAGESTGIGFNRAASGSVHVGAKILFTSDGTGYGRGDLAFTTKNAASDGDFPSEVMRLKANGNVGVGTTSPTTKLSFGNRIETTKPTIATYDDGAGAYYGIGTINSPSWALGFWTHTETIPKMVIGLNGNVGIGTSAPGEKLHVSSGSILLDNAQYIKQKDDTGTARTVLGTLSDGTVTLNGYHQNPVITAVNGATYFSGGSSTNMTILTGGNVGIGTTNPDKQLTMHSAGLDNYIHITSSMTGTTAADGVMIGTGTAGDAAFYNRENTNMLFLTNNIERVRIDNSGNVGIGTTAPQTSLDVSGRTTLATTSAHVLSVTGKGTTYSDAIDGIATFYSEVNSAAGGNVIKAGSAYAPNTFVVKDNGNVSIGTTSPSYPLHVSGTVYSSSNISNMVVGTSGQQMEAGNSALTTLRFDSDAYRIFAGGAGGSGEIVRITETGNVGIGTTSPNGLLDVRGGVTVGTLGKWGIRDNAAGSQFAVEYHNGGAFSDANIKMVVNSSGNVGVGTISPSFKLDVKGSIGLFGGALTGGTFDRTVVYSDDVNHLLFEAPVVSGTKYNTYFSHRGDGASGAKMVILGSGNVGVGTTSPSYKLEAVTNSTTGFRLATVNSTVGSPQIDLYDSGRSQETVISSTDGTTVGTYISSYSNHPLMLGTYSGNTPTAKMTILQNGNVGLGTTIPGLKLQSQGSIGVNIGYQYMCPSMSRDSGGIIIAGSQSSDCLTGWYYGGRIIEKDYGDGLNMEFDTAYAGVWTNNALVVSGRTGRQGFIGIGLTNPSYQLQLSTDSAAKPGTSTWTIASDERLKDIRAPFTRGLDALNGLHTIYFNYKQDNPLSLPSAKEYVGIRAQDVLKVIPEAVSQDEKGYYHVTNDSIIWTVVNAVKELYRKFIGHDEQLAQQARAIAAVQKENEKLKNENAEKTKQLSDIRVYLCVKDPSAPICK